MCAASAGASSTPPGGTDVVICDGNDHTIGGCRVGDDRATSVVDRDLRYDHPNIHGCDVGAFVTSGGDPPSQTMQAIATRLAHHLGDPSR
jgi:choline dehydrogenase-like flavoprotein